MGLIEWTEEVNSLPVGSPMSSMIIRAYRELHDCGMNAGLHDVVIRGITDVFIEEYIGMELRKARNVAMSIVETSLRNGETPARFSERLRFALNRYGQQPEW